MHARFRVLHISVEKMQNLVSRSNIKGQNFKLNLNEFKY